MAQDTPEIVAAKLRDGCVLCGHEGRAYETVDEVATDAVMAAGADLIQAQAAEIARLAADLCTKTMGEQLLLKLHLDAAAHQEARLRAALSTPPTEQPAAADTLARELAACLAEMRLGMTATKCPVFPEEIAAAAALDRADAALSKARAAGLLPEGEGRRDNG